MKLPTREKCFELLKKYGMVDEFSHMYAHIELVNKIAVFLAKKLNESGEEVNIELVDRASLLHDIAKPNEIKQRRTGKHNGARHGEMGFEILKKEGYPEISQIIRVHVLSFIIKNELKTWEEKIVQYADDRVNHNKIVLLDERIIDAIKRYRKFKGAEEEILKAKPFAEKIEKEIFDKIGIKPEDLVKYID